METLKKVLKYATIPFVILGAILYSLILKVQRLKSQLNTAKVEKELGDVLAKKEEASRNADAAVADFRAALKNEGGGDGPK